MTNNDKKNDETKNIATEFSVLENIDSEPNDISADDKYITDNFDDLEDDFGTVFDDDLEDYKKQESDNIDFSSLEENEEFNFDIYEEEEKE